VTTSCTLRDQNDYYPTKLTRDVINIVLICILGAFEFHQKLQRILFFYIKFRWVRL